MNDGLVAEIGRMTQELERIANALEEIAYDEVGLVRTVSRKQEEAQLERIANAPEEIAYDEQGLVPFPLKSISRTASGGCIVRITQPMSEVAWGARPKSDPEYVGDGTFTHQIPCPYTEGFLGGSVVGEEDPDGFAPLFSTSLLDIAAELAKAERGAS